MQHQVVSREEWLVARRRHLEREKEFTRSRDRLSAERRGLPWVRVDKAYHFAGPNGEETLADLFAGRSQLIVYHFMFGPGWEEGCKSCSYLADHFDGAALHLAQRDVTLVVVSRAPMPQVAAFQRRMGWRFHWVSSFGSDFNHDYRVSFTPDRWRAAKSITILPKGHSRQRKHPVPAYSTATRPARSSTPIRLTPEGSTSWSVPTIFSTWRRRGATRTTSISPWPGSGTTIATTCRPLAAVPAVPPRRTDRPRIKILAAAVDTVAARSTT
jgi:predicted dithiol-disulfide oxidoreductase (DUF899 family)